MNLPSWRQVIHPHRDVAEGRYRQAEFAADLAEVLAGTAEPEYQDPAEFFHRTYLTHGIRQLLGASLQRVGGKGGEPVVQLKTAFGGGKTHTMLALYHLLSGKPGVEKIASVRELVEAAGLAELPQARFAVLDGTDLDPAKPRKHAKLGISTRTLWGEMALQIGGKEGYEMLRASDEAGTAPGTAEIKELFDKYGPCVVLVDELVAYVRNLVGVTKNLPGGSYDANITFTQRLTQAAKRSTNSLVVASIPESDIEIGGAPGQAALEAIEHHIGRIEAVWKPVAAEEGFEIVRRRLFAEVEDEAARERVCRAYQKMYKDAGAEFPTEAASNDYLARMLQSYPIHPEVFDRLYDDWGTLERFQKTRGVLRLMAAVIHELWTRQDAGSMILPGSIPLDAPRVREELTRYLPEPWGNVVDKDVDGERSEPAKLDRSNQRLGDLMAARRVARAIFMGSAPSVRQQKVRGIQEVRVRLGVVQPGEHTAVYTDALGRLTQNLTHLYSGEGRYWYDTTPNLRKTVEDKAREFESHQVLDELVRRLRLVRDKGDFDAVHVCAGPADVPDEQEARLVILPPEHVHRRRNERPAEMAAKQILENRGNAPRKFRNMLVFVAPDDNLIASALSEIRHYLAWQWVVKNTDTLNLDAFQRRQAAEGEKASDHTVDLRVSDAYCWLIVPTQEEDGQGGVKPLEFETTRLTGGPTDTIVAKASRKVRGSEQLITRWSPAILRMVLDRWLWKNEPHLNTKKLWEYLTTYTYLPRLKDSSVLLAAIREGIESRDYFAYATGVDANGRYLGLRLATPGPQPHIDESSVLVKLEAATKQLQTDAAAATGTTTAPGTPTLPGAPVSPAKTVQGTLGGMPPPAAAAALPTHFYAIKDLDATRVGRDAADIAKEVVQHLASLEGAEVEITLEIQAKRDQPFPEDIVRTVKENCKSLRFRTQEFN